MTPSHQNNGDHLPHHHRRDSTSVTSHQYISPSRSRGTPTRTQYEYDMRLLNDNIETVLEENEEDTNGVIARLTSSESESSEENHEDIDAGKILSVKTKMNGRKNHTRRPSILGV